jgi:dTDP-4-dehydrorhamnose reductase
MKILILGSTGILGRTLDLFLSSKKDLIIKTISTNKKNKYFLYFNHSKDLNKLKKLILKIKPSHIVNCIGITKYNNSYNSKTLTNLVNTKLPLYLASLSLRYKIYLIHISTDCVFLGQKGNYDDNATKDASDNYGISKSKGEVKNKYTTTIRTSFIGPEGKTKKSLLNWFLTQKITVNGYTNAIFSGLTSLELSKIIYKYFIQKNTLYNKIMNVGGNKISKFSLLKIISKIFKKKIHIKKLPDFKIDRSLNSKYFRNISKYKKQSWKKMIKDLRQFMLNNEYKF